MCQLHVTMGEFGVYDVGLHEASNCSFTTAKEPVDIYARESPFALNEVLLIFQLGSFVYSFAGLFLVLCHLGRLMDRTESGLQTRLLHQLFNFIKVK